jgi:hypothetical protein
MTSPALTIASGAALTRGGARSARVCFRRPQSVVELAGTSVEFVRHGEVQNRFAATISGSNSRARSCVNEIERE